MRTPIMIGRRGRVAEDERMGRGGEGDCAVRILFDQHADRHGGGAVVMRIRGCEEEQASMSAAGVSLLSSALQVEVCTL